MNTPTFNANGNFAIHVPDLDRAFELYRGILGLKLLDRSETNLVFEAGVTRLYVVLDETEVIAHIPAFSVPSFDDAVEYLEANSIEKRKDFGTAAYFEDPFGIVFDIVEE